MTAAVALPETMPAVEISAPGAPEVLRVVTRPCPRPAAGEVLIAVAAAGVNRPDVLQRQGHYPPPPGASDLPGLEVAGVVAALGEGVSGLAVGDRVCALLTGGGYAGFCAVPAVQCLPVPAGLSLVEAASLPETCFTVWSNVFDRAGLTAGETFLVHGGASGIGVTAIQLARLMGARVFATAGTTAKCDACRALGAEQAILYAETDFVAALKAATDNRGIDVVLDMVGGDTVARNLDLMAPEGRLVFIAFLKGPKTTVNLFPLMLKRLTLTGSTLRPRPPAFKGAIAEKLKTHVWPAFADRRLKPVIHATFPLSEAAAAHRLMESNTHIGKIVLTLEE